MSVTESKFYMWRALFALAHADFIVSPEEIRFMAEAMEDVPFSEAQYAQLIKDLKDPADIEEMFEQISDVGDQAEFFKFAHVLVHIDGDYGQEEQAVMLRLKELHMQRPDLDKLVGNIALELEVDEPPLLVRGGDAPAPHTVISAFRQWFLGG
jgi:uncharacterized membrane protein YebE (DUF533 family)